MDVTGQHIHYLHVCKRKLWLVLKGIRLEATSERVGEGKLVHETTYKRRPKKWKELNLGIAKIDHYDPENRIIKEIKLTDKLEAAHEAQVRYYLYLLMKMGIKNPIAHLEYPLLKKRKIIRMSEDWQIRIARWIKYVEAMKTLSKCPEPIKKAMCQQCSFYDFCYIDECP